MTAAKKFSAKITKKQCMEFGQVATLAVLIFALHYKNDHWVVAAFVLILITIILPVIFYPFALVWFGLSELLSIVSPAIILTIIFFLVVTPVGLIRRLLGKDSMRLKQFKKDKRSVMIDRNHLYTESDFLHTF
jgi:membrane protein implicated in regulation of membrane protease activity